MSNGTRLAARRCASSACSPQNSIWSSIARRSSVPTASGAYAPPNSRTSSQATGSHRQSNVSRSFCGPGWRREPHGRSPAVASVARPCYEPRQPPVSARSPAASKPAAASSNRAGNAAALSPSEVRPKLPAEGGAGEVAVCCSPDTAATNRLSTKPCPVRVAGRAVVREAVERAVVVGDLARPIVALGHAQRTGTPSPAEGVTPAPTASGGQSCSHMPLQLLTPGCSWRQVGSGLKAPVSMMT